MTKFSLDGLYVNARATTWSLKFDVIIQPPAAAPIAAAAVVRLAQNRLLVCGRNRRRLARSATSTYGAGGITFVIGEKGEG